MTEILLKKQFTPAHLLLFVITLLKQLIFNFHSKALRNRIIRVAYVLIYDYLLLPKFCVVFLQKIQICTFRCLTMGAAHQINIQLQNSISRLSKRVRYTNLTLLSCVALFTYATLTSHLRINKRLIETYSMQITFGNFKYVTFEGI